MSVKVNKKSVRQMGGGPEQLSMIPPASGMQQPQQPQVDPAIQQISMFFSEAIEKGGKPEEIVMGLMQQNVEQETIGQALMMMGYEQDDVITLFEQVNLLANAKPADAQQVNQNPQELARNQALAEKQKQAPVKTEPIVEEASEEVMMAKSGIEIKKENRGKFTKWAKARGMGVQEAARKVLANKDRYPPSVVKMANFARNAASWKKEEGGEFKPHMMYKGNKAVKANTYEEHLALGEQGFVHKDELKKANYGREFLPSGVASASNAVPFDLNVDLGAYTSLDGDIDFPMFGVEGDPSGSIIRPQMQVGPGTDGGANPNETTNNDDPNANNSGDPSNNEEIITTESVTTTSPSWMQDAIKEGGNPLESENYKMMLDFMKKANTNVNVNTGNEEVDDPNVVKDKGNVISGNNVYLPPNLYSQGPNFSLGNAFNSIMRVGNNLFSGQDTDGDGLKDGVLRDWRNKSIQNKIDKYKNATYNVDVDLSEENVNQAGIALQKFLYENPTADDQYDAVGNLINKGAEENNIPISTDDIDPTTAEKFKSFLEKGTEGLSEAALKTYNALKEKLGYRYGGDLLKMQPGGEPELSFRDWVLQDPVNRSGPNAQAEYDAFIAETALPDFGSPGGGPSADNANDGTASGPTENPGVTALDPSIDKDQDGIPDTIDVDAGDGTGVGGSFQDAYDKINMPTITPDFGGIEGALTRGYNSNLVKGWEGISGGIIDITANILNPIADDRKQKEAEANLRSQVVADNIYDTQVDPFNARGKNDINRGTSGSEGDRTTGLYLTQGRLAKAGGGTDNPGFRALPPSAQQNILDNMAYGGPKGEDVYLARKDAAIKASMAKAQRGGGGGAPILLNALPNFIFKDPLGKKLLNFDEDTAEDFVDVYNRAMDIGKSDDVVSEGISFFQDFSKKDLQNFMSEAGITKQQVRNYVYDQDWYDEMPWYKKGLVKTAMSVKGLKKGGETVNVDSATLAKLIAAGADIEML